MRRLGIAGAAVALALPALAIAANGGVQGDRAYAPRDQQRARGEGAPDRRAADDERQPRSRGPQLQEVQPPERQQAQQRRPSGSEQRAQAAGDPQAIAREARSVLQQIDAAVVALRRDDTQNASQALDRAASTLRDLYAHVPALGTLGELERARAADQPEYAPLGASVRERAVFLDPEVVAGVEEAEEQAAQGQPDRAADQLLLARSALVADIGLLPLDAAYAHVLAARSEIEQGRHGTAIRLLESVPVSVAEVTLAAPLVPVRFDLRAAAAAAEAGEWDRARTLLQGASSRLERIRGSEGPPSPRLDRLASDVARLEQQVASNQKPDAADIRQLAARSRQIAELGSERQAMRGEGRQGPRAQGRAAGRRGPDARPPSGGGGSSSRSGGAASPAPQGGQQRPPDSGR